jgi:hypothetical protein
VVFRLTVADADLDKELAANARLLSDRPIKMWPEKTDHLKEANLNIRFDFIPLNGKSARTYERDIELYDPAGGAFTKHHQASQKILDKLCECSAGIAFFPADTILKAVNIDDPEEIDEDLLAHIREKFAVGLIIDTMMKMNEVLNEDDIFPVCFVITKLDLIPEHKFQLVNEIIYDNIIIPFSKENKNLMICICPISVINRDTGNFKSFNLEWPFLFAAHGAIMREANFWRAYSKKAHNEAKAIASKAARIRGAGFFDQLVHLVIEWETHEGLQERADANYATSSRYSAYSKEEKALADDILSSISDEKDYRGITVLINGSEIDP